MPASQHSVFYRPDALPAAQPTVSKHWRHKHIRKSNSHFNHPITVHYITSCSYFKVRERLFFTPHKGPRNHVLDGVKIPCIGRGTFGWCQDLPACHQQCSGWPLAAVFLCTLSTSILTGQLLMLSGVTVNSPHEKSIPHDAPIHELLGEIVL